MYGKYAKELGSFAKDEAQTMKLLDDVNICHCDEDNTQSYAQNSSCLISTGSWLWRNTIARLNEDWVFLMLLGIVMAILSYVVDLGIASCINARLWLLNDFTTNIGLQFLMWISLSVLLVLFSAGVVHVLAPHSAGSGIPEVRTIIRGVDLKEYLTFKTLVAKVIGLIATLGSGMPLGKEGPFVHIASIVAHLLSKMFTSIKGVYENESRKADVLVAASAVGIAACFASPVGGVFFSIEVTTTYFAIRNYWRGFFASVCGATAYRLFAVWANESGTLEAPFRTSFVGDFPFGPQELFAFAFMGVICGVLGALFVWILNRFVIFVRSNKILQAFLNTNRFIYPALVSCIIASLMFPHGTGRFLAGERSFHEHLSDLYSNFTWTKTNLSLIEKDVVDRWSTPYSGVLVNLFCFSSFTYIFSIIASTMPIPCGMFIPVMRVGAGLGRFFGEVMHLLFPLGLMYGGTLSPIIPGGYAVVGTAAFAAAVTHTVSVAVILFEMSGQITHVVPLMIAVLIAKAVASMLHSSLYDSMILIKKLPYLPDILPSNSRMYSIYVEDFMVREIKYIWNGMTYQQLKVILNSNKELKSFPIVEDPDTMILLGSIKRRYLLRIIAKQVGRERRLRVASKWHEEAEARAYQDIINASREESSTNRRPSRFEIGSSPSDKIALQQYATDAMLPPQAKKRQEELNKADFLLAPKKSILKKTYSTSINSQNSASNSTITAAEQRVRSAFDVIFRKSRTLQDVRLDSESVIPQSKKFGTSDSVISSSTKKVQLPKEGGLDMLPPYQMIWEEEELAKIIDWARGNICIDPAPFQLVERTTLPKVHSLFSLLGIHHAYVTKLGDLIGVVSVKELRKVIEEINSNNFKPVSSLEPADVCEPLLKNEKHHVIHSEV